MLMQAILATKDRHSATDAAVRILPNVSPLTVDPVSEVRQSALLVVTEFAKVVREHCVHLDEKAASEGIQIHTYSFIIQLEVETRWPTVRSDLLHCGCDRFANYSSAVVEDRYESKITRS